MQLSWSHRLIALGFFTLLAIFAVPAVAHASGPGESPLPAQVENQVCLSCHSNKDLSVKLPSGETLSLYIDAALFNQSVHGQQGQRCTACHTNISGYPHPPLAAKDARDFSLQMYTLCQQCHGAEYQKTLDSIHAKFLAAGDRNAAVCTDCHTAHYVTPPDQPRSKIPQTCQKCHSAIYNQYKSSVHGAALLDQSNPDVPTCIDCHGVHNIGNPTTNQFRLNSPQLCAKCHADKALMSKYNISTNVFSTYVSDFHGTTVELFQKQSPDQPVDTPVCYDCHGVHDIKKIDDPNSPVFRENLLKTCQQCHPNATANFPSAWMSHYIASPEQYPVVYYVNLFYMVFIPLVLGAMAAFVVLDLIRRILNRFQNTGRA
jgi:predicted CXXCH cytochrome family protein